MNQRGEIGVLCAAGLAAMTGLILLLALELHKEYSLIKRRTHLLLCTKEAKGELLQYLEFMGKTNWALENIQYAQLLAAILPGLQGAALSAEKVKKIIQRVQDVRHLQYKSSLFSLLSKKCPVDQKLLQGPLKTVTLVLRRNSQGLVMLRSSSWSHNLSYYPYHIELKVMAQDWKRLRPLISVTSLESKAKSSWRPFLHSQSEVASFSLFSGLTKHTN
jgi:hypothetical protein